MSITVDFSRLPEVINPGFYPLLFDNSRYLILVGGGGSGKSVFASQKVIYRCMTEPGHRILVVRKVMNTLRDSVFAELVNTIDRWGMRDLWNVPKGRSSDLYLRCKNGSEILFAGLDDVEKLKSIARITGIWIEEASELDQSDYRQLDIRLRGQSRYPKQMIITFNPIYKGHWLEEEFLNVDWSPKKDDCTTHHSTYKDNLFLDDESKAVLEAFRDTDEYYYMVYCLGEWGVLGKTIFPKQIVTERISFLRSHAPLKEGYFAFKMDIADKILDETIRWIDEPGGYIRLYQEPVPYHPYVIGGDTAGDGSDFFVGYAIDNATDRDVAVLHHEFDEHLYAHQMYCLGRYYNSAMLSIETNYSTFPVKELERLGYYNQFRRDRIDKISHEVEHRHGFWTDKLTRPVAIAGLVKEVTDHINHFWDIPALEEMLTFVRNEKGKATAQEGKHDDLIMARAIARYSSWQQIVEVRAPKGETPLIRSHKDKIAKQLQPGRRRAVF